MKLSIIIPAYNEEKRIENTLKNYLNFRWNFPVELIVVCNGCTDRTPEIVEKISKRYKNLKYVNLKEASKGKAIITGFELARGDLISHVDADYSTAAKELNRLIKFLNNYDGVIGSRWIKGAKIIKKQPLLRRIASRGFNLLVRLVLNLKFKDTQCGAKIYKKKAIKSVLPKLRITNWAIDVSILYPLVRAGYNIKEVPTTWEDKKGSRLKLWKAIPNMLWAVIKLRFKK